jgi:ubiquinone/menaquinone biosynthesis C-methylase UbiE
MMVDLSYQEKQDRLESRIRAHKKFANFDIDQWIEAHVAKKPRHDIFDLACGNGNHFRIYLAHLQPGGTVTGLDREKRLLEEARRTYPDANNLRLELGSMDEPLPFADGGFDLCFCNFAIYNAADPEFTLTELRRVMKGGSDLVLIGPTAANARELYEYNQRLTGQAIDPVTFIRTDRLRQEILPVAQSIFPRVSEEIINSFLTFPDQNEFLRYFTSTMVYEEGAEKQGKTMDEMRAACVQKKDIILSKEMLAVVCTKE